MILSGHFQKLMAVKVIDKIQKKIDGPYKKYVCRITGIYLVIKKIVFSILSDAILFLYF